MQLVLSHPLLEPFVTGQDLKVVVACENSKSAEAAAGLLARLALNSGTTGRLIYSWWNFEVLTVAVLRKLAAQEAAAAELVVVAAPSGPDLPPEVLDWMSLWLATNDNRSRALVALLESKTAGTRAAPGRLAQLKHAAALGRMDFFANGTEAKLDAVLNRGSASPPGGMGWRPDLYATNCRAERGLGGRLTW